MTDSKNISRAIAVILAVTVLTGIFLAGTDRSRAVTVNGTAVKYNKLQFLYVEETVGDETTVIWELWCVRTKSGYDTYKKSAPTVITIDGVTVVNEDKYYDVRDEYKRLHRETMTIKRTDGSARSIPFSASVDLSGTSVGGKIYVSGSIELAEIEVTGKTVTAEIDWIDNDNAEGRRPETVTAVLYRDGEVYGEKTVGAGEKEVTFENLPAAYGGVVYNYTVGGRPVDDYTVSEPAEGIVKFIYNKVPEMGFRIGFSI